MRSNQSGSNDSIDDNEPDNYTAIPDFARAWESDRQVASSVRRPTTLLDPQLYHEVIEPQAVFELDERQKDGSIQTIFVVPSSCTRCRFSLKQACSRARPACARCRNVGLTHCEVVDEGYQKLPGPKFGKPSLAQKQSTSTTPEKSVASPFAQEPTSGRSHLRRTASRGASISQAHPSNSVASGSKRPLSPESDPVPPRKKAQTKTASRKGKGRCVKVVPPAQETDVECSEFSPVSRSAQVASAVESTGERSTLRWKFVNREDKFSQELEHVHPTPSNTSIPRIWTNVRIEQTMFYAKDADVIVCSHLAGF